MQSFIKMEIEAKYDVDFLETLVYEWLRRSMYYTNFRVSNAILLSIGHKFKRILDLKSFQPDIDWVCKFRTIYNVGDVDADALDDIGYKCSKSIHPEEIFDELRNDWELLDPKLVESSIAPTLLDSITLNESNATLNKKKKVNKPKTSNTKNTNIEVIEISDKAKENCMDVDDNSSRNSDSVDSSSEKGKKSSTELLDFEDELPVCTIFGRESVEKLATIMVPDKTSKNEHFVPMIVCTDPKDTKQKENTKDEEFNKNVSKEDKIKDQAVAVNKVIESDLSTLSQNKYMGEFLNQMDRSQKQVNVVYPMSLQPTEICNESLSTPKHVLKSKLTKKVLKAQTSTMDVTDPCLTNKEHLSENEKPLKKPRQKRKIEPSPAVESATIFELPTKTINIAPVIPEATNSPLTFNIPSTIKLQKVTSQTSTTNLTTTSKPTSKVTIKNLQTGFSGDKTTIKEPELIKIPSTLRLQMKPANQTPTWNAPSHLSITKTPRPGNKHFIAQPPAIEVPPTVSFPTQAINQTYTCNPSLQLNTTTNNSPTIWTGSSTTITQPSLVSQTGLIYTLQAATPPDRNSPTYSIISPMNANLIGQPIVLNFHSQIPIQTPPILPNSATSPTVINLPPAVINLPPVSTISEQQTTLSPTSFVPLINITNNTAKNIQNVKPTQKIVSKVTPIQTSTSTQMIAQKVIPIQTSTSSQKSTQVIVPKITPIQTSTSTQKPTITTSPIIPTKQTLNVSSIITKPNLMPTAPKATYAPPRKKIKKKLPEGKGTKFAQREPLRTYEEVVKCIKLMEDFAMINENFRLIGFLERLENKIQEEIKN